MRSYRFAPAAAENNEIVALAEHADMHRVDGIGVTSSREVVYIGGGQTLINEEFHSAASR